MRSSTILFLLLVACGARPPSPAAPPSIVGTWRTSTRSYEAARTEQSGARLAADGTLEVGTFRDAVFVPIKAGPSPGFVARWQLEGAQIRFLLDGAEEVARVTLEPPDRWKTDTITGDPVTVYYVRADRTSP